MQRARLVDHVILVFGSAFMLMPVLLLVMTSTHDNSSISQGGLQLSPGNAGLDPYRTILFTEDLFNNGVSALDMLVNSTIVAVGIATVQCIFSMLAAYALIYFRLPGAQVLFGIILVSMFFPVETRIIPTFLVTDQMGLLNTYTGMILPVAATGLGTLVFRQFLRQIPDEMLEAAKLDGAGPLKFLWDILLPLSLPMVVALFAMLFVIGWNQYMWPLMINTTSEEHYTIVRGIERVNATVNTGMALAVLAMVPPLAVMLVAQRWIVRSLMHGFH
ncbi:MAG: carbohydrate ABC transporter permease [Pseudomonadota bacterium]